MTTYRLLRQHSRAWWYHKQLREQGNAAEARRRENASVRSNVKSLRETIANHGYLTLGRGGFSLHPNDNTYISGYGCDDGLARIALQLGIATIDSRSIPDSLIHQSIKLPLVRLVSYDPAPWGGMSYAPLPVVAALYQRLGATIHNLEVVEPAPDQLRGYKQWEADALIGYQTGNTAMLGKAMLDSRDEEEPVDAKERFGIRA